MKKILFTFAVVCLMTSNVFAQNALDFTAGEYEPKGELVAVKAKGLVCDFCAKALEKVFLKQEEVSGITVNLTTKEILISFKEGQTMTDEKIKGYVIDAGYNIENLNRDVDHEIYQ